MRRLARTIALLAAVATLAAACGDDGGDASTPTSADTGAPTSTAGGTDTTAATTPDEPVRIVVTNDDGVDAEGIDALVQGLESVEGVEVTVVAPATNQSGQGGAVADGPLTAVETTTASGHPATAVQGTPADTIVWAVDQEGLDFTPTW